MVKQYIFRGDDLIKVDYTDNAGIVTVDITADDKLKAAALVGANFIITDPETGEQVVQVPDFPAHNMNGDIVDDAWDHSDDPNWEPGGASTEPDEPIEPEEP